MNITTITQNNFTKAIRLLEQNGLPTKDLSAATKLFVLEESNEVVGTIALEHVEKDGLLRSLSVSSGKRKTGLGELLVRFIEDYAKKQGVENIYLLTTTAAHFFAKRGYKTINREDASPFLKSTSEYCSVCPASATVMMKTI
jgi:amino-acid N-acetyltransferase